MLNQGSRKQMKVKLHPAEIKEAAAAVKKKIITQP
jgi:hypothetical protein